MGDSKGEVTYLDGVLKIPTENGAIVVSVNNKEPNVHINLESNVDWGKNPGILVKCNKKGNALEVLDAQEASDELILSNNEEILECISRIIGCNRSEIFNKIFVEKNEGYTNFFRLNINRNMVFIKECNNFGEFVNGIEVPLTRSTEKTLLDKFTNVIVKVYDYKEVEFLNFDKIACNFTNFLKDREASVYKNRTNIVKIKYDDCCYCAEVLLNDTLIMSGNYWDFYNDCHGGAFNLIEGFNSYSQLADILIDKINMLSKSLKVELVREKHKLS